MESRPDAHLSGLIPGGSAVPLHSSLSVERLAWASVSMAGAALSPAGTADPDPVRVAAAFCSDRHLQIDGRRPDVWSPLSRFWRVSDGWVRTHGNYAHHARALRAGVGLHDAADESEVGARLSSLSARQASIAIGAAGGICVPARREQPQIDVALRRHPLVEIHQIGDAAPRALPRESAAAPLAGVRVLDLTRVIAGPVATRTLAFAGADVLRIDPPHRAEFSWQHLDTGHGKRTALLDIRAQRSQFEGLAAAADVIVLGYRPAGLRRLGLSAHQLAARHPSLVIAQLSAWPGDASPRGFDSIVQAESGISWIESPDGETPGALPAQVLDHSAGYLLAAGVASALRRRAQVGGAWWVRTSLRRMAAELLGLPRNGNVARMPEGDPSAPTQTFRIAGSQVTTVMPAVRWPGGPDHFAAPRPWGQDCARW